MKHFIFLLLFILLWSEGAAQKKTGTKISNTGMELIANQQVREALTALESNKKDLWYSFFTNKVTFTDDGRTLDFKSFFDNAFAHKERFLSIDKVDNNGKTVQGNFFAGQWGTFKVYFRFHQNAEGKFDKLEIGQVG